MNTCTFAGRVVADAEIRATPAGKMICKVRIASDSGWGEHKKTHWLDCAIFGQRGERLAPYLTKGSSVTVVGELEPPRTYQAQGETRVAQSLVVRELALQGSKGTGEPKQTPSRPAESATGEVHAQGGDPFGDDLPWMPREGWAS